MKFRPQLSAKALKSREWLSDEARAKMAKTKSALKITDNMIGDDTELRAKVVEGNLDAQVAQLIYQARVEAGLTQTELAELVGTRRSAIARLEDADYEGHSLSLLEKVAAALGRRLIVSLAPMEGEGSFPPMKKIMPASAKGKSVNSSSATGKKRKRA